MYEGGLKSGARKVTMVVFVLVAIGVIFAFCKIVLDHIDSDGTVTSSKDSCANEEGMSALQKAGVFGGAHPRCNDDEK